MDQHLKSPLNKVNSFEELFTQAENHTEYWVEGAILEFTEEILQKLKTSGVSRAELAERLGNSRPQISRLLSGQNNFTLRTMVEVSRALNCELRLHLQSQGMQTAWIEYSAVKRHLKLVSPANPSLDLGQPFSPRPRLLLEAKAAITRDISVSTNETVPAAA